MIFAQFENKDWYLAAFCTITALLAQKLLPWFALKMKYSAADRKTMEANEAKGLNLVILHQGKQIDLLRAEVENVRRAWDECNAEWENKFNVASKTWEEKFDAEKNAHVQCRLEMAELRAQVKWMSGQLERKQDSS